jgi:hypothetical protein
VIIESVKKKKKYTYRLKGQGSLSRQIIMHECVCWQIIMFAFPPLCCHGRMRRVGAILDMNTAHIRCLHIILSIYSCTVFKWMRTESIVMIVELFEVSLPFDDVLSSLYKSMLL